MSSWVLASGSGYELPGGRMVAVIRPSAMEFWTNEPEHTVDLSLSSEDACEPSSIGLAENSIDGDVICPIPTYTETILMTTQATAGGEIYLEEGR